MLSPKIVKWRKQHRGKRSGKANRANKVDFGFYGLKAVEFGRMTARQIEASRIAISRSMKRGGKMWIRVFPDKPITVKPAETRMGSGKGNPEYWVCIVKPGRMLFEVSGIDQKQAMEAFRLAANKLPFKTKFIARR